MIIQELKDKYNVSGVYQGVYLTFELLFSGHELDPELIAHDIAWQENLKNWDVTFAIGPSGIIITQIIEFKTKEGLDRYIRDKIIIFDYNK